MVASSRERRDLNRALHELRRPLQALLLLDGQGPANGGREHTADGGADPRRAQLLGLAAAALSQLDLTVNGGVPSTVPRRFACRELVLSSLERWTGVAASAGQVSFRWSLGAAPVEGDPVAVAQALDNLIANAVEHGELPLAVRGTRSREMVRITVANRTRPRAPDPSPSRSARRGHGLQIVSETMRAHGGRFAFTESGGTAVAALELPLARPDAPLVPHSGLGLDRAA